MTHTLADWDEKVKPHLHGIIAGASMVSSHVSQLVYQPIFETFAAGDLETIERTLSWALEKVRTAKRDFHAKPQEPSVD